MPTHPLTHYLSWAFHQQLGVNGLGEYLGVSLYQI